MRRRDGRRNRPGRSHKPERPPPASTPGLIDQGLTVHLALGGYRRIELWLAFLDALPRTHHRQINRTYRVANDSVVSLTPIRPIRQPRLGCLCVLRYGAVRWPAAI